jgi:hypothetical protein
MQSTEYKSNAMYVEKGCTDEWLDGDSIAISTSEYPGVNGTSQTEYARISLIDRSHWKWDKILLDEQMKYIRKAVDDYWGKVAGNITMYPVITLLERNIKFITYEAWKGLNPGEYETVDPGFDPRKAAENGAHIVIGEEAHASMSWLSIMYAGNIAHRWSAVYEYPTEHRDGPPGAYEGILFQDCNEGAMWLHGSFSRVVKNVTMLKTRGVAFKADRATENLTLLGNLVMGNEHARLTGDNYEPVPAFSLDTLNVAEMRSNVVAGGSDVGFMLRPKPCSENLTQVYGETEGEGAFTGAYYERNEAFGTVVGFLILRACFDPGGGPLACAGQRSCVRFQNARAWKNSHIGVFFADQPSNLVLEHLYLSNNHIGVTGSFHRQINDMSLRFRLSNSVIWFSSGHDRLPLFNRLHVGESR